MTQPELPMASHRSTRKPGTRDGFDFLPTPPWATRAFMEQIGLNRSATARGNQPRFIWEPACGKFDMLRPLQEPGHNVIGSDIVARVPTAHEWNFLSPELPPYIRQMVVDWVITNPPFVYAEEFIQRAFEVACEGVAMLVRTNFLEGEGRYERLFSKNPPTIMLQFAERVPMHADRLDPNGSTMTAYMWLVWIMGQEPQPMRWIPPCRDRLEKPGDYDQYLSPLPLAPT